MSVIFVSHKLDELYAVCDRVTVLRDGQHGAARPPGGDVELDLVATMIGR